MALTKITTSVIAANTLATANIADNSVDATKIAANSILTRHIDDNQVTGDQLADNITIAGNLTITGDLTTNGSTVTNSSTNTTIEDAIIELGTGTSGAPATDAGIVIERGSSDNVFIGWDESADKVIVGTGSFTGASTGNLTITAAPLVSGALTASGLTFPTSDGSSGQVISTDGSGTLSFADNTTKVDNYTATGDGSTTAFDTGINPGNEVNTWIFIDGVYQQKSQYSYSGSTVTFTTSPENGALIDVITGTSSNITASDTVLGVYEATTTNTDAYSTGISAANENNTWVFVGGVYQPKDSYTFSSGTLTFDANTPTGQKLSVVATKTLTAGTVDTASLAANAISSAKIASNAILSRHIVNNSIVGADISATTQITANTFTGALTGNVTGNVAGNLTGTIQTAAQTNITSVGTLSALTVSGQLTAGGLSYPTSDGTNEQVLRTDGSGNLSFGTISGTTLNNNTNNYVMTGTGTTNTLNGESGLTYDGSTLDVTGTADVTLDLNVGGAVKGNAGTRAVSIGTAGSVTGGLQLWSPTTSTSYVQFGDEAGTSANHYRGYMAYNHTNDSMSLGTSSSTKVTIDSSGNVGIGGSPQRKLYVMDSANGYNLGLQQTSAYNSGNQSGIGFSAIYDSSNNVTDLASIRGGKENTTDGNFAGNLRFHTRANGGSDTERMRIDSSGKVGIGTSIAPHQKLTVTGSSGAADGVLANGILALTTGTGALADTKLLFGIVDDDYAWIQPADYGVAYRDLALTPNGGRVGIGTTSPTHQLDVEITATNTPTARFLNKGSVTGYTNIVAVDTWQSNGVNHQYLVLSSGNGSAISDNEFNFRGDGQAYADGSWNGGGADYAEYFEWSDGNSSSQDRVGYSVSLVNNKIKIAESGETVIGVISGNPAVVGDNSWNKWKDKYQKDDYGRYIRNSDGHRISNPDYDDTLEYVKREDRKEWDIVGLMGKLRIKKGQQTGTNWIKMRDISDAVEEWLVR